VKFELVGSVFAVQLAVTVFAPVSVALMLVGLHALKVYPVRVPGLAKLETPTP
jgi:hypothetical protein